MKLIISENQLNRVTSLLSEQENRKNLFEEKYNNLSEENKKVFEELFQEFYPESKGVVSEAKWWNVVGDVVGIFDPTGIVDIVNGLDYIRQGDTFFGMLSMISAIPYVGDVVAKPIIMAGKGSRLVKGANAAIKTAKSGNTAKAIADLNKIANSSSVTRKLFGAYRQWAPKLKAMIDKIPGGKLSAPLKNTLKDTVDLFGKVGGGTQKASAMVRRAAMKPMTKQETINLARQVKKAVQQDARLFRSFGGSSTKGLKGIANWKLGGVPRLFGNRAVRSLMVRTKFWAGFLDYIGVANFVGPDETINQMGKESFDQAMNDYSQTAEGQKNWRDDFSNVEDPQSQQQEPQQTQTKQKTTTQDILSDLLFGPLEPLVP
jgi:hypothetical protein